MESPLSQGGSSFDGDWQGALSPGAASPGGASDDGATPRDRRKADYKDIWEQRASVLALSAADRLRDLDGDLAQQLEAHAEECGAIENECIHVMEESDEQDKEIYDKLVEDLQNAKDEVDALFAAAAGTEGESMEVKWEVQAKQSETQHIQNLLDLVEEKREQQIQDALEDMASKTAAIVVAMESTY